MGNKKILAEGQIDNVRYEVTDDTWLTSLGAVKHKTKLKIWSGEYEYQGRKCRDYSFPIEPGFLTALAAIYNEALKASSPSMLEQVNAVPTDAAVTDDIPF